MAWLTILTTIITCLTICYECITTKTRRDKRTLLMFHHWARCCSSSKIIFLKSCNIFITKCWLIRIGSCRNSSKEYSPVHMSNLSRSSEKENRNIPTIIEPNYIRRKCYSVISTETYCNRRLQNYWSSR
jgi:hypothetical protein